MPSSAEIINSNQHAQAVVKSISGEESQLQARDAQSSPFVNAIFQEPWWLDAVAPGEWSAAEVKKDGETVARLPYVVKKKYGLTIITNPKLTQTLGPWLRHSDAKYAKRLGQEKDLIEELLAQLPKSQYCNIPCHHSITNTLPFHWAGFEVRVLYTYRLTDLSDLSRVWEGCLENIRREIRKAKKQLEVQDDLGLDKFLDVNEMTFRRQNQQPPYGRELVRRLDSVLAEKGRRRIFFAVDAQRRIHAVTYLVWDNKTAYYLMGGADPSLRTSGASSLLMWHAIQHAATVSDTFDFEGSMIKPVERFFRAFGGIQTPYYRVAKMTPLIKLAREIRSRGNGG